MIFLALIAICLFQIVKNQVPMTYTTLPGSISIVPFTFLENPSTYRNYANINSQVKFKELLFFVLKSSSYALTKSFIS